MSSVRLAAGEPNKAPRKLMTYAMCFIVVYIMSIMSLMYKVMHFSVLSSKVATFR